MKNQGTGFERVSKGFHPSDAFLMVVRIPTLSAGYGKLAHNTTGPRKENQPSRAKVNECNRLITTVMMDNLDSWPLIGQ
jgi:hypothetical protein